MNNEQRIENAKKRGVPKLSLAALSDYPKKAKFWDRRCPSLCPDCNRKFTRNDVVVCYFGQCSIKKYTCVDCFYSKHLVGD